MCLCGDACECMWGPKDSLTCHSCTPLSSAPLCFFETGSLTDLDLPKQGGRMSSEPKDSSCRRLPRAGITATHYLVQIFYMGSGDQLQVLMFQRNTSVTELSQVSTGSFRKVQDLFLKVLSLSQLPIVAPCPPATTTATTRVKFQHDLGGDTLI